MTPVDEELLIFVYGSLRQGERDHAVLEGATFVGYTRSAPGYRMVDLTVYPALIEFPGHVVYGELYRVTREIRRRLDVLKEVPVLFQRTTIGLEDGRRAETYTMREQQVRGRRRLRGDDWKQRFAVSRRGGW